MNNLFAECLPLKYLYNIYKLLIKNEKDIGCIFAECTSLNFLPDISNWNIQIIKNMNSLFRKSKLVVLSVIPKLKDANEENSINSWLLNQINKEKKINNNNSKIAQDDNQIKEIFEHLNNKIAVIENNNNSKSFQCLINQ